MADTITKEKRSEVMSRIRSCDTKPELIVRRYLYARGYRYRKNVSRLPGTPDIVLRRYGVAIFVHGCFWHGHEAHYRLPKDNREFWQRKIDRNRERDQANKEKLRSMGWDVVTIWECQLKSSIRGATLAALEVVINQSFLKRRRGKGQDSDCGRPRRAYGLPAAEVSLAAEPDAESY